MTVVVGILCSDGVVIAADSAATFSAGAIQTIGQQTVTKIWSIEDTVLYAASGAVGIAQLAHNTIETLWKAKQLGGTTTPVDIMTRITAEVGKRVGGIQQWASTLAPVLGAGVAGQTSTCHSLIAVPLKKKPVLFQLYPSGAPELATTQLPFIAVGVGQPIADPFLAFLKRILWKDAAPTVAEARFAATWTVKHVIETIPGGVGPPIQLATLAADAVEFSDPAEHIERVAIAEQALRDQIRSFGTPPTAATPEPPKVD